ncbi:MAG: ABC transporter permease, partial [Candidatus Wallbacteria bacterium]|nr:ABC transporter permease [Candidatus Wallbacteria bacterium]
RAFPVFVFCGYVPWLFFSSSLINSCYSLYRSQALMEETYFPREIPVIAEVLAQLSVNLITFVTFLGFFVFSSYLKMPVSALVVLPVLLIIQLIIVLAISLALALCNVFFRDIAYFVDILLTIWFYLTPIFYPLSWVPERVQVLIRLNPVTAIIEAYRALFYDGLPVQTASLLYPLGFGFVLLLLSWRVFAVYEKRILEEL